MKYKVGDRVKVKSLQWFNENSDDDYNFVLAGGWYFSKPMSILCGKELIIEKISYAVNPPCYIMKDNTFAWTDEMIEGLVEEETKPNIIEEAKTYWDSIKDAWICPDGYIFKDENGNVINATKIVLEKKKKEYPKTYEECCRILEIDNTAYLTTDEEGYWNEYELGLNCLIEKFRKLLICRDAYWKLYGEEMGLDKPWEPRYRSTNYMIALNKYSNKIQCVNTHDSAFSIFSFPTAEMRDAFYENFKELINECKELL